LAELPVRILDLTDEQTVEIQIIENSQRAEVHPYEEATGYQRLLAFPGYDVAAVAGKCGKSQSHIYARLALLQLVPQVAEAFQHEKITASHANLIARLPQDSQAEAFEACWRRNYQDNRATPATRETSRRMDTGQSLPRTRGMRRSTSKIQPSTPRWRLRHLPPAQRVQHFPLPRRGR
jgi:ParB-like chromosome segregation protein Spo0J